MGGMGFIHSAECEIMHNSLLINTHMSHAAAHHGVPRYLFSSSACVYRDQRPDEPDLSEDDAYPAQPDNEYGWEKLYSERVALAYQRNRGMTVRIARFQNCYGPYGTWNGGREKAPAAMCRKIAAIEDGGTIDVWGDGTAMRVFTYVDDLVDGICLLMKSDVERADQHRQRRARVGQRPRRDRRGGGRQDGQDPARRRARSASTPATTAPSGSAPWAGLTDTACARASRKTYPWVKEQTEDALARGETV